MILSCKINYFVRYLQFYFIFYLYLYVLGGVFNIVSFIINWQVDNNKNNLIIEEVSSYYFIQTFINLKLFFIDLTVT